MSEKPPQETIDRMHRWFAVECNNGAWDLASRAGRTDDENRELLYLAYAAAWHWSRVGTPLNSARAEVLLAHVHALLGHGPLALQYAQRCLAFFGSGQGEDWDLAFAHMVMAHAAAASGDAPQHAAHYAKAQQLGAAIVDAEDRRIFLEELTKIPRCK